MKLSDAERDFGPGEQILSAGVTSHAFFVIRTGEVRIEKTPAERLGPGDIFGELGAILGCPEPFGAVAESEVRVLVLDASLLTKLCAEPGEFSLRLIRHLARSLEAATRDSNEVTASREGDPHPLGRITAAILARAGPVPDPESASRICAELQDLADAAGLSLEEAYPLVQRLFERQVLRIVEGGLELSDRGALTRLAAEGAPAG